ncbi:hypothetical protein CCR94_08100 [Rhodoblastus sphagnicola]|uniref:Iron dicitrate transport regulator FecR n=1 Tax=Rhodoblastus sphagnicola TaxID=333368 RepID=A0A2S6NAV3_9HYPH|nr:FecR domain-containing protein [Rhodoblastus sphagnicola]MBB4198977.1 transmembrane sensor [Rhodoblastus sphagnicola]PPQ31739.1 hypothetical protein CCR94_08100 [Rhodoblastus sphagnicola]
MPDDVAADQANHDSEAYDWVRRFALGQASPADLEALKLWCAGDPGRAAAFDRVSRAWRSLEPLARERSATDGVSNASRQAIAPDRPRLGRRALLGGALAASAAGVAVVVAHPPLGLWPSWSELAADYRTATGEQRHIMLTDNASIDLNTQTSIVLRPAADHATQIELIAGEAMVEASGGSVTLRAADGRIVAADARFNVRFRDNAVCVCCLEGHVRIERRGAVLLLGSRRQAVYSGAGVGSPTAVDPAMVASWRDGVVIFQSTSVKDVIAEVNRYRSGKIILINSALGDRLFNARLRIENLDRVVGQIEQAFGARARTLPGGVVLLG